MTTGNRSRLKIFAGLFPVEFKQPGRAFDRFEDDGTTSVGQCRLSKGYEEMGAMTDRQLERLYQQRQDIQQQLEWHEANHAASAEDVDDGTEVDLRDRIKTLSDEIAALECHKRKD
jgi:hypothetical protein